MKMMNMPDPDDMTSEDRLSEAATILATGIKRFQKKQEKEKIPLDKSGNQCPYGQKSTRGERA